MWGGTRLGLTETYIPPGGEGWVVDNSKNQIWREFTKTRRRRVGRFRQRPKGRPTTLPLYHTKAPAPAVKQFHLTACRFLAVVVFGRFSPISYTKNFFQKSRFFL